MNSQSDSRWVAGVDGCRAGWFVVLRCPPTREVRRCVVDDVQALLDLPEQPAVIAIDMVIGLPDAARTGGRDCDRAARKLLGWPRSSSVFSPPVRDALQTTTYAEALMVNRASSDDGIGLSIEAYNLFPKLRELDELMTAELQERFCEVHPEVSFYTLNDERPLDHSKHVPEGRAQRIALLQRAGWHDIAGAVKGCLQAGVQIDDILDAHAACWTAERIQRGEASCMPPTPPADGRGLQMAIWR